LLCFEAIFCCSVAVALGSCLMSNIFTFDVHS
jgi:hypothetical protein